MLFTFLVLLFILLSGKITGEILVFSILSSFVISVFAWKFLGWTRQKDFGCIKRLPAALGYAWVLLREIIKANLAVMLLIIRGTQPRAIIVRFSSNLRSGLLQTVLANSITITPGTLTLKNDDGVLYVHALDKGYRPVEGDFCFQTLLTDMERKKS